MGLHVDPCKQTAANGKQTKNKRTRYSQKKYIHSSSPVDNVVMCISQVSDKLQALSVEFEAMAQKKKKELEENMILG